MRTVRKSRSAGLLLSLLLLLCSCAATPRLPAVGPGPELPADVTLNKDAGRGSHLIVTLRSASGAELPFMVDTGGPMTLLDESLEPQLGECLGTSTLSNFGVEYDANCYAAPRLYLGNTPLVTDSIVLTSDFLQKASSDAGRPVMGILGMDCLQHYCIQLDFKAGKMRFLDPNHIKPAQLGTAFPLTFSSEGQGETGWTRPYIHYAGLAGGEDIDLLIDVGHSGDGGLDPELFRRAIREHRLRVEADSNDAREPNGAAAPQCVWNGRTYTDVYVGKGENALGLRFLARHLVTFDFPRRTLYLKRTRSGPLVDRERISTTKAAGRAALQLAGRLIRSGQLPGWSKEDPRMSRAMCRLHRNPDTVTLDARKKGDSSVYHYKFTRASEDDPWKLQRAWRTDQDDRTIEEYPVP